MSDHDVVVIGAGLAGLRCARDLVRMGRDPVVLEARDRVGGRVFSHRFANGQVCERGAEFIDANHTDVLALAAELGLTLSHRRSAPDPDQTLLDAGGRAVPLALHASIEPARHRFDEAVAAAHANGDDRTSLADVMDALELSALARLAIGREIRTEFMLPPDQVGVQFAARIAVQQSTAQREIHRVVGGNDQLATGLAAELGGRVHLGAVVRSIDEDGRVEMADGTAMRAGAIVAAVPLPVLSRIWTSIPGPLAAVGWGIGGKISVQFQRRIWLDYGRNGTVLTDRSWGHLWETTDDQYGDEGVLTNLLASHDGASFVSLPTASEQLIDEVDRIFPGARGLAGERVVTDWTDDPFSLGCYSCFGPGQLAAAERVLHEPVGRVWIAGEHADLYAGFMEGALRSGAAVAAALGG